MQDTTARVLSCEPLAQELVRLILSAPEIAAQAKAGQFIHMLVPDSGHVLRRPISLMAVDAAAGTLTLAIQPKGAGTQMLCACKPGETIRVLGPLGTGFDGRGAACVYFVGGGVGVGDVAWTATDISNALMALPNILMVLLCAGMVGKETQHYVYDGNIDEELRADIHELPEHSVFTRKKA